MLEETGVVATPIHGDEHDLGLGGEIDIQIPRPYALMYQTIPASRKDEEHIHLDMAFALEADESDELTAAEREVHDVKWLTRQEITTNGMVFDSVKGFAEKFLRN